MVLDPSYVAEKSLGEMLEESTQRVLSEWKPVIGSLSDVAITLKMSEAHKQLKNCIGGLERPEFHMIVFGRFKAGKSTLLNALLGKPLSAGVPSEPLVTAIRACTAKLTKVRYGEEARVFVVYSDGRKVEKTVDDYKKFAMIAANREQHAEKFKDIVAFEIEYPFECGRAGVIFFDSPGTEENRERDLIVEQALGEADASITVFSTNALAGAQEQQFVEQLRDIGLGNGFLFVNCVGGREVIDEDMREFVWERIVREAKNGPKCPGGVPTDADFARERIFFVDAKLAAKSRAADDHAGIAESGILGIERALNAFYEGERRTVHLRRWLILADAQAGKMYQKINDLIPALSADQEAYRREYTARLPEIEKAQARIETVKGRFTTFRSGAAQNANTSFRLLFMDIKAKLPQILAAHSIKVNAAQMVFDRKKQERVVTEVGEVAVAYVNRRVQEWASAVPPVEGAGQVIQPLFDLLLNDLKREVDAAEKAFAKIKFELHNYESTAIKAKEDEQLSWWGRVLPTAAGLAFGPDMAAFGAVRGWKGFGKALLLHAGVVGGLAIVFGPVGWVLLSGWIITFCLRCVFTNQDIGAEIKGRVIDAFNNGDPEKPEEPPYFDAQLAAGKKAIEESVERLVAPFEREFMRAFQAEITEQVRTLEEAQAVCNRNSDEKAVMLEQFRLLKSDLETYRDKIRLMLATTEMLA